MKKPDGLKRSGNTITITCRGRKEAQWMYDEMFKDISWYRVFRGEGLWGQWTPKQVSEITKQCRREAWGKKHIMIIGVPT